MLVTAAARVMARDGIAQTTTRAITAEAGMPRGSFHYCFRSKDELLQELIRVVVGDMVHAAEAAHFDDRSLAENLQAGLRAMWESVIKHPDEQLVTYELTTYALRDETRPHLARWQYENYYGQAINYLTFVARSEGIEWSLPMPVVARLLVTMVDGLSLNWLADRDSEAALGVIDAVATQLANLAAAADSILTESGTRL
jgi:AcrR family transcriptional regulator